MGEEKVKEKVKRMRIGDRFRSSPGGSVDERNRGKKKEKQKAGRRWERSLDRYSGKRWEG